MTESVKCIFLYDIGPLILDREIQSLIDINFRLCARQGDY